MKVKILLFQSSFSMKNQFPYIGNLQIFEKLLPILPTYSKIFILLDKNTAQFCYPIFKNLFPNENFTTIIIPAGENQKNIQTASFIWEQLIANHADRKSLLLNLGGGMITDLGGYVASNFMRGIDFIQIPTSLLAQVDASVGGKTGINFQGLKNILGAFAMPKAVFICTDFLDTLPKKELKSGYAEMIKHALIAGNFLWKGTMAFDFNISPEPEAIENSVKVKYNIVEEDWQEKGLRKVLNLGHTLGHAFESLSLHEDENPLLHGEAVALGIYYEAILAHKLNLLAIEKRNEICQFIAQHYAIKKYNNESIAKILAYIVHDKKNKNGKISFSLLQDIGKATYDVFADIALIEATLYENIEF